MIDDRSFTPVKVTTQWEGGDPTEDVMPQFWAEIFATARRRLPTVLSVTIDDSEQRASDEDDHYYGAWSGGKKSEGGHAEGEGAKAGGAASPGPYLSGPEALEDVGPNSALWAKHGSTVPSLGDSTKEMISFTPEQRSAMKAKAAAEVGARIDAEMTQEEIMATPLGQQLIANYWDPNETYGATIARKMHDLWADTSGDSTDEAIALQQYAAKEFGLTGTADSMAVYDYTPRTDQIANEPLYRAYARAEYENTQAMFKAEGVSEITLFRGIGFRARDITLATGIGATNMAGKAQADPFALSTYGSKTNTTHAISSNPLSSWSGSPWIAASFAMDRASYGPAYVMSVRVPVSRVMATPMSGAGCLFEYEAIVLGGPDDEAMVWRQE